MLVMCCPDELSLNEKTVARGKGAAAYVHRSTAALAVTAIDTDTD
jgi:hypothetical protein